MVYAQPRIFPGEWNAQTLLGFWKTNRSLISTIRPDFIIINKKQQQQKTKKQKKKQQQSNPTNRICRIVDFAVPADHRVKLKESQKKDKYIVLAKESIKLWNTKVTGIPIVIGALDTVTKGLRQGLEDLEIRGQVETSKLLHYRDWPECWEESRRIEKTCRHSNYNERPSANANMKNSQGVK